MDQEVPNPFQATFPPTQSPDPTSTTTLPESPEKNAVPNGKTSRKPHQTRSAPITRPRKTASKKASAAPKKKRGRPAKVASADPATGAGITLLKKARKPRSPAAGGMKIELGAALNAMAGLKQEDAVLLGQIVTELLKKPKGARTRIIGALGKVLA